jgi:5-methylcytosine-specific restriction enzyme subunit McrC
VTNAAAVTLAKDCSPIRIGRRDEEDWLRKLVLAAKPADMLLHFGHRPTEPDDEPIASFDAVTGTWWSGRYVGEVEFEGRTLRVEPRFGMPALMKWLTTIWGVRLLESKGKYEHDRIWLWLVIAYLWTSRVIVGAKHGLPFRRVDTVHHGPALRGRLLPRQTALLRAVDRDRLASVTRTRMVDPVIGGILLSAFERLRVALGSYGEPNYWLPERGRTIVEDLRAALGTRAALAAPQGQTIRYSPMTESYRPAIELSLSIIERRPRMASTGGQGKAFGILVDMAEIWELYVSKVLQASLPGLSVNHTGRLTEHICSLLHSGDTKFGSLKPDIVIFDRQRRCRAVADAKYKNTRINTANRTGILREDLYQITAYLAAFGDPLAEVDGFLIYPTDVEGQVNLRLATKNPWQIASTPKWRLWFFTASCDDDANTAALNGAEQTLSNLVRSAILSTPLPWDGRARARP